MEWKTTFPKVSSLAKFASKLIIFLFSTSSRSLLLSFSLPICGRRLFRGFHADSQSIYLSVARGITKRGSLKLVDAVTCEGKRKLTGFDSPAKCCSFFFRFFLLLWGKKKSHKYCRVCVFCFVLSALCGFMAVGEKMLSRLGILFRVAAVLVKIGGHVLYDNIGFACLVIFSPFFLPIFIARESLSFF